MEEMCADVCNSILGENRDGKPHVHWVRNVGPEVISPLAGRATMQDWYEPDYIKLTGPDTVPPDWNIDLGKDRGNMELHIHDHVAGNPIAFEVSGDTTVLRLAGHV